MTNVFVYLLIYRFNIADFAEFSRLPQVKTGEGKDTQITTMDGNEG
jgi:hypothetical protein